MRPRPPLALLCVFTLLPLLLAACSLVQMGYGQADRLIAWRLEEYVPLDAAGRARLEPALARLHGWHCRTQLPAYAAWLRDAGADLGRGSDAARIERHIDTLFALLGQTAAEAARDIGPVVAGATPAQLAALNRRFERNNRDYVEDWVRPPAAELQRERAERLLSRLEDWTGRLGPAQRARVEAWARDIRSPSGDGLDSRRRWQAALSALLARRDLPADAFARELEALFVQPARHWTAGYARAFNDNRTLAAQVLADLSLTLTDTQRRHLQREIDRLAGDLEAIRCRPTNEDTTRS